MKDPWQEDILEQERIKNDIKRKSNGKKGIKIYRSRREAIIGIGETSDCQV